MADLIKGLAAIACSFFVLFVGVHSGALLLREFAPESPWTIILGYMLFPVSIAFAATVLQGFGVLMLPFFILSWLWPSREEDEEEEDEYFAQPEPKASFFEKVLGRGTISLSVGTFAAVFGAGGGVAAWVGQTSIVWGVVVCAGVGAAWCIALVVLASLGWILLPE